MAYPPEFSSTETYANRYDLDEIDVFLEGDSSNPMFFNINGLPENLSFGKHYFYLSTLDSTNQQYKLRNNSKILFEFKSINNVVLRSDVFSINQRNGIATCFVEVLEDPLRTFKEIGDGQGTLTIVGSLEENIEINIGGSESYILNIVQGDNTHAWSSTNLEVNSTNIPEGIFKITGPGVATTLLPNGMWAGNLNMLYMGNTYIITSTEDFEWSLPLFPQYFEEFDFDSNGILEVQDVVQWNNIGRLDIAEILQQIVIEDLPYPPSNPAQSRPPSDFFPSDNQSQDEQIVITPIPEKFKGAMNYRCKFPIQIRKNLINADSPFVLQSEHKKSTMKGQFSFVKANISPLKNSVSGMTYNPVTGFPSNQLALDEGEGSTS